MDLGFSIHMSTCNPTPPQTSGKDVDPNPSPLVNIAVVSEVAGKNQEEVAHKSCLILLNARVEMQINSISLFLLKSLVSS